MTKVENVSEETIFSYAEQVKELISSDLWDNILLDCSKNEILVLWLLYRQHEANMTQIAEYIHVPLNTATGIVSRMEKKELLLRTRSEEDKRVVIICMGEKGKEHIQKVMGEILFYIGAVMQEFDDEEMAVLFKFCRVLLDVMKKRKSKECRKDNKIRKITID